MNQSLHLNHMRLVIYNGNKASNKALLSNIHYYKAMPRLVVLRRHTQPITGALIRQHLKDPDLEDSDEDDATGPEILCSRPVVPGCGPAVDLVSCKSWLDRLCEEEQSRLYEALNDNSDWAAVQNNGNAVQNNGNAVSTSDMQEYAHDKSADCLDTRVLQRIRQGRGPRDWVAEDLLAVFRDGDSDPCQEGPETYEDMQKVLLSWNERVGAKLAEGERARMMLSTAVNTRRSLLRRSYPGNDREKALEVSSAEMLHALTSLRPEVAGFHNQDSLDILLMMWANVRVAVPDLDDELRMLTMRALIDEIESRSNAKNAEKISRLARWLSVAQLEGNDAETERLKAKVQAFELKIHDTAIKKTIDKIKATRRELAQIKLKELLKLTELQAAQKWAAHEKWSGSQDEYNLIKACDQADNKLRGVLQQKVPELDAHVQVVQSNANGLANMSASLFNRANEAGFSLEHDRASSSFSLAEANIKAYVSGTVADVADARVEAAKMLDRMGTVEAHLDELLDAAKSQYWAYDDVLRVLEEAAPLNTDSNGETKLAEEYGPRRESILLMARNAQRVKYE